MCVSTFTRDQTYYFRDREGQLLFRSAKDRFKYRRGEPQDTEEQYKQVLQYVDVVETQRECGRDTTRNRGILVPLCTQRKCDPYIAIGPRLWQHVALRARGGARV
jgi:hypothetical protein